MTTVADWSVAQQRWRKGPPAKEYRWQWTLQKARSRPSLESWAEPAVPTACLLTQ